MLIIFCLVIVKCLLIDKSKNFEFSQSLEPTIINITPFLRTIYD